MFLFQQQHFTLALKSSNSAEIYTNPPNNSLLVSMLCVVLYLKIN